MNQRLSGYHVEAIAVDAFRDYDGSRNRQAMLRQAAPIDLDQLCRMAACEMIAVALEAGRRAYLEAHAHEVDEAGRRLVVGNGHARPREITTASRALTVTDRRTGPGFGSAHRAVVVTVAPAQP